MASTLSQLSGELVDVVAATGPSVAQVDGRRSYPVSGLSLGNGEVITAHHTLGRNGEVRVHFSGEAMSAEVVGRDASTNLALLRAAGEAPKAPATAEVTPDSPAVGGVVLALGRPGRTVRAALGIVGAHGEAWRTGMGGVVDAYLEPSIRMFSGFTGGPLVDAEGRVVGINMRGLAGRTPVTVPMSTIERVAAALRSDGHVKRGYLGVSSQPVELPDQTGVGLLVLGVEDGGPADVAGVHMGDAVVAVDGSPVSDHEQLLAHLGGDRIGQALSVTLLRTGKRITVEVTVGERPRRGLAAG